MIGACQVEPSHPAALEDALEQVDGKEGLLVADQRQRQAVDFDRLRLGSRRTLEALALLAGDAEVVEQRCRAGEPELAVADPFPPSGKRRMPGVSVGSLEFDQFHELRCGGLEFERDAPAFAIRRISGSSRAM